MQSSKYTRPTHRHSVRMVEPGKHNPSARVETRFSKYVPVGQGWLETEVELNPVIFEPGQWVPPEWVR